MRWLYTCRAGVCALGVSFALALCATGARAQSEPAMDDALEREAGPVDAPDATEAAAVDDVAAEANTSADDEASPDAEPPPETAETEASADAEPGSDASGDALESSASGQAHASALAHRAVSLDVGLRLAPPEPRLEMGAWGAPFALVPGLGLGHLTTGQRRTGLRLMAAGLGGLGLTIAGVAGLAGTGASRRTITPIVTLALVGINSFLFATIADLVGSIARGRLRGTPMTRARGRVWLGAMHIYDPQFGYGPFLEVGADMTRGVFFGEVEASIALGHSNQRLRVGAGAYLRGQDRRGSHALVRGALTYHRFGTEGFRHLTGEVLVDARLELKEFGPSLRGTFVFGELGLGLAGYGFDAVGRGLNGAVSASLLMRGGFGFFLGDVGEFTFFYDHRRDGFEGGLSTEFIGAGNIGFLGVDAHGYFGGGDWGLRAGLHVGSAWVTRLSIIRRWR